MKISCISFCVKENVIRRVRYGGLARSGFKTVRIGKVRLGNLPEGQWRYLREDEQF
jgi:23S rRNA pseudouridine2604 synthase